MAANGERETVDDAGPLHRSDRKRERVHLEIGISCGYRQEAVGIDKDKLDAMAFKAAPVKDASRLRAASLHLWQIVRETAAITKQAHR